MHSQTYKQSFIGLGSYTNTGTLIFPTANIKNKLQHFSKQCIHQIIPVGQDGTQEKIAAHQGVSWLYLAELLCLEGRLACCRCSEKKNSCLLQMYVLKGLKDSDRPRHEAEVTFHTPIKNKAKWTLIDFLLCFFPDWMPSKLYIILIFQNKHNNDWCMGLKHFLMT